MHKVTTEFKGQHTIFHYLCSDGKLKYYTGEYGLTKRAERIKESILKLAADYRLAGKELTRLILRSYLDSLYRPEKASRNNLITLMTGIVDKMESGEIKTPSEKRYASGSIKTFRHTVRLLERFDKDISNVTIDTYKKFITWCQKQNYSTNYIGGQIKNWKTLGGALGDPVYKSFKKITEKTHKIYLTGEDITRIYELPLKGEYDIARDWFIIDCYTGLRVSDLRLLTDRNLKSGFITIATMKTGEPVKIPVNKRIRAILKKYKGFPPPMIDQKINKLIKPVAKRAKITGTVLFTITKGGKRVDKYMQKWEVVTCHSARRSFITNLRKDKMPTSVVKKLTGIKSTATIDIYDKLSADEAATIAKGHRFFK